MAKVKISFGNKKTWDISFEKYFLKFAKQGNDVVFNNGKKNSSFNKDIIDWNSITPDLIYST